MKAKTFDNRPHGWSSYIYDNSGKHIGYFEIGLPNEERADAYTNSFNSALSAHVAKETASKDKQIEIQQAHIDDQDQLIFDQTKEIADLKENINRLIDAHMGAEKEVSELKEAIAKLIQVKTRRLENAIKLTQE